MGLDEENAALLIKSYDDAFKSLQLFSCGPTTYPQKSRVYTAKYTTGHEDGATCDIAIETGPKAVLDAEIEMLKAVFDKTSMTLPSVLKVDHTGDLIPESYIILDYQIGTEHLNEMIPLKEIYDDSNDRNKVILELHLGTQLRELHAIDNMWFGVPSDEAEWGECISWQETFTLLLETALMELEARGLDKLHNHEEGNEDALPLQDLRRALASAIAFYLFDDAEVPSLIWCAGLDWASHAYTPATGHGLSNTEGSDSAATSKGTRLLLGCWGGPLCLWGDPLMEAAFRSPSKALLQGYGEPGPIVFARQHTKRLWYTVYAALCQLLGANHDAEELDRAGEAKEKGRTVSRPQREEIEERMRCARKIIVETAATLKGAPCY